MSKFILTEQTEQVLEWPTLLNAVANEAASSMGAELCRGLPFSDHIEDARVQQQETFEFVQMFEEDSPLSPFR